MSALFIHRRTARFVATLAAIFCAIPAFGTTFDASAVIENVATLIDNNYFDAAKAHDVATALRGDAKSGRFDLRADPRDLSAALTARLRPFDRHFNVTWTESVPSNAFGQRSAYGFRRVEMLPGAIGYIDLRTFADFDFGKPDEPARKAIDAALALIAGADAVIIDLRYNGGGLPAMVGYLVSAFTPASPDIYNVIHRRDGLESEQPRDRYPSTQLFNAPLYVLISGRSASAAESAAYTLQAAGRAIVVGERSHGAANPGGEFPVGEGFNVFISTGTPVNPITGSNWEGVGVRPDVPIAPEHALDRAEILALEAVLARSPQSTNAKDTLWVLEALRAKQLPPKGAPLPDYVGAYADANIVAMGKRLSLKRGGHPALSLLRVRGDTFAVDDEPFRRVIFERDASGSVRRFQFVRSSGQATWHPRTGAPATTSAR